GKILIKEKVHIKESVLRKLESMQDQYKEYFKIRVTNSLATRLGEIMVHAILPQVEKTEQDDILAHLYIMSASDGVNYKNIIANAFQNKFFTLAIYKIFLEKRNFFYHIVEMGLLTMGVLIQKPRQLKFLYRNAFLAGLLSEIVLSETELWSNPIPGEAQLVEVSNMSSEISKNLGMPDEIVESLSGLVIPGIYAQDVVKEEYDISTLRLHPLLGESFSAEEAEETDAGKIKTQATNPEDYPDVLHSIAEALKIAKFIQQSAFKIPENKDKAEALITMFSYNLEKEIFDRSIAEPMIVKFRKYEKIIKKIKRIAQIEKKCKFPPSAWAYPKPNATQILCQYKVANCPYLTRGWDINVVSPQEALGYIGTPLMPDSYPKCKLEKELDRI
ncbi:MAG: hypothetical protein AAF518_12935, partial [Spirochaetota bacterium]